MPPPVSAFGLVPPRWGGRIFEKGLAGRWISRWEGWLLGKPSMFRGVVVLVWLRVLITVVVFLLLVQALRLMVEVSGCSL